MKIKSSIPLGRHFRHCEDVDIIVVKGWSDSEVTLLWKLHNKTLNSHIAQILGRTLNSVTKKASMLGLKKHSTYKSRVNYMRRH